MKKSSKSSRSSAFDRWVGPLLLLVLLLLGAAVTWSPSCAQAQDEDLPTAAELSSQCAPEVQGGRRAALSHDGVDGFWFHGDVARCLLQRYSLLAPFARRVELLEDRLRLQNERDALQERRVALAAQEAEAATEALEAAVRRAREAEEALDAWYRHPALWFTVGVVVTVVLEVVAVWGFSQLRI